MDVGRAGCPWRVCDLVQPRFCMRLGGGCARSAWISCHLRGRCRIFDRKGHPAIQEKIRAAAALMMSNFSQGGRNFLSEGEIHITLN